MGQLVRGRLERGSIRAAKTIEQVETILEEMTTLAKQQRDQRGHREGNLFWCGCAMLVRERLLTELLMALLPTQREGSNEPQLSLLKIHTVWWGTIMVQQPVQKRRVQKLQTSITLDDTATSPKPRAELACQ